MDSGYFSDHLLPLSLEAFNRSQMHTMHDLFNNILHFKNVLGGYVKDVKIIAFKGEIV